MKIRIKGNSLRLRLTQPEVAQLSTTGIVEESIQFNPTQKLVYTLEKEDCKEIIARFYNNQIVVEIPQQMVQDWAASDRIGMENHQLIEGEQSLFILIEKDFKCLTDRTHEDESDMFPHPEEDTTAC